jgi:hypothetical protein
MLPAPQKSLLPIQPTTLLCLDVNLCGTDEVIQRWHCLELKGSEPF